MILKGYNRRLRGILINQFSIRNEDKGGNIIPIQLLIDVLECTIIAKNSINVYCI